MSWFSDFIGSIFGKPKATPAPTPAPAPRPVVTPPPAPVIAPPPSLDVFHRALAYTFRNEGGFSNVKEDLGGATNFGIIREELGRWRGHDVSEADVKTMKRDEAEAIYKAWYWDRLNLGKVVVDNVAVALFDRAVLNGLTGDSRHVRAALGYDEHADHDAANFDVHMNEVNASNPTVFLTRLADHCEAAHRARVAGDSTQKRFLYGWLNRVNRMRRELAGVPEHAIEQWVVDASGRG